MTASTKAFPAVSPSLALPAFLIISLTFTGAASLMYQVAWFRSLGLVFGVTVHATSAVLAAFMGGLAIGSLLSSRFTARMRRPLAVYGGAELVIGLIGAVSLPLFDALQPVYRNLALAMPDALIVTTTARFSLAFGIMLIPTTLMGATLPFVVAALSARSDSPARVVSFLYAANTMGAIAGAFLAAFYLIGPHGLDTTTRIAAVLNVLVGIVWLVIGYRMPAIGAPAKEAHEPTHGAPLAPNLARMVLISYAVSGGIALANEVVWTRILSGIFPVTVYAFAIMLCTILGGIALGSWIMTPLMARRVDWLRAYIVAEIALALACGWSLIVLSQAYRIELWLEGLIRSTTPLTDKPWYMMSFAALAIGPAALLMGILFPIATRVYASGSTDVGKRVGQIYGANVIGGIAGSLAAGLLLIPAFGAQNTLWLLAGGNLLAAILVLVPASTPVRTKLAMAGAAVALFAGLWAVTPNLYASLFSTNPHKEVVEWYAEGQDATIRVARLPEGAKVLYINSAHQGADTGSGLEFHYRLGHLGMLLHPEPNEVLVIGLGVGATPGAAATHSQSNITVVELHEGVVEGAKHFNHINYDVLERPNVTLHVLDGRNFLLTSAKKYDVIEADLIQPMNAGAANLYSVDYYRLARESLKDDGIMIQWVNNALPGFHYRLMMRSFIEVFPNATLWHNGSILVGSKGPLNIDVDALEAKFRVAGQREALAHIGLRNANDVLREYVAGPADLAAYVGPGQTITDRYPRIEYFKDLPFEGLGADEVRTIAAARLLTGRLAPGDGIIWGHPSMKPLITVHAPVDIPELFANTATPLTDDAIQRFVAERKRVWFVPWSDSDDDARIERWLNTRTYKVFGKQIGQVRLHLFASSAGEPARRTHDLPFGNLVALRGWGIDKSTVEDGDILRVAFDWETLQAPGDNLKVRLRLIDTNGSIALSRERSPSKLETRNLPAGATIVDRIGVGIPPGTPPGVYRLELVVYRESDSAPLDPADPAAANLATIRVTEARVPAASVEAHTQTDVPVGPARLVGYTLDTTPRRAGDTLPVTMIWKDANASRARLVFGDLDKPIVKTEITKPVGAVRRQDARLPIPPVTRAGRYQVWLAGESGHPILLGTVRVVP